MIAQSTLCWPWLVSKNQEWLSAYAWLVRVNEDEVGETHCENREE